LCTDSCANIGAACDDCASCSATMSCNPQADNYPSGCRDSGNSGSSGHDNDCSEDCAQGLV
jgi:hypothetical protein